jgi:DNA polymerase V
MKNTSIILPESGVGINQKAHPCALLPPPSPQPELCHRISAGFPSPAADYVEQGLDLNTYLVQHKAASFFFNVTGESMIGAAILDGDKVLVDRSVTPQHGHIVIAVIDSEYTLKRLHLLNGKVELHPDNPAYAPIRLVEGNELQIWGVVTAVIRKLRV